jgi:hypothetical protein
VQKSTPSYQAGDSDTASYGDEDFKSEGAVSEYKDVRTGIVSFMQKTLRLPRS